MPNASPVKRTKGATVSESAVAHDRQAREVWQDPQDPQELHGFDALLDAREETEAAEAAGHSQGGDPNTPVSEALAKARSIKGITFIVGINVVLALVVLLNVVAARNNEHNAKRLKADALVVADPARVTQVWTRLPDGMSLTVVPAAAVTVASTASSPDGKDGEILTKATNQIRRYLRHQRKTYLTADYSDPRFGSSDLPGRADLEFGTAHEQLNVRYADVPHGGQLRWITTDSVMLDSLNEWAKSVGTSAPVVP